MNYGPMLFLAAFFAISGSWLGFVAIPQLQVGRLQATNMVGTATYPAARPGEARQGAEVYRANGCFYCHSQQVGQESTRLEVALTDAGTNQVAVLEALQKLLPNLGREGAGQMLAGVPATVLRTAERKAADAAGKLLGAAGAKTGLSIIPVGPDIARGWGRRRSVAEDYLLDYPVMLGVQRVGPDLANIGLRKPDWNWQLRHLYAPPAEVSGSTMPSYRFLFETRKAGPNRSGDALVLPREYAPPEGFEIVPKPEARALVAYLLSLRADAPLFVAPLATAGTGSTTQTGATNAVSPGATATDTNRPTTNPPAQ